MHSDTSLTAVLPRTPMCGSSTRQGMNRLFLSDTELLRQFREFFPTSLFKSAPKVKNCAFQSQALVAFLCFFSRSSKITSRLYHARFLLKPNSGRCHIFIFATAFLRTPQARTRPSSNPKSYETCKTQCFVRFGHFTQPLYREIAHGQKRQSKQRSREVATWPLGQVALS